MSTVKFGKLDATITAGGPSGTSVVLVGRIDDSAVLSQLVDNVAVGAVTIDTDGVVFVNSIGVREWMRLLRGLHGKGCKITLQRVADVLITQMNMIPDVRGTATIASFHAQYACPSCGYEADPIIDAVAHQALLAQMKTPPMPCGECDAQMELADYPERYLTLFA